MVAAIWLLGRGLEGYGFGMDPVSTKVESTFGKCVFLSGIQQAMLLVLAGFVLDQGETQQSILWMCGAYWCLIAFVVLRRREQPYTTGDKSFARWGFLAILVGGLAGKGIYALVHWL